MTKERLLSAKTAPVVRQPIENAADATKTYFPIRDEKSRCIGQMMLSKETGKLTPNHQVTKGIQREDPISHMKMDKHLTNNKVPL